MSKGVHLKDPIRDLPFISPKIRDELIKAGFETVEDLVYNLPIRYEDWRKTVRPDEVTPGQTACLEGRIVHIETRKTPRTNRPIVRIHIESHGRRLVAIFFNQPYRSRQYEIGDRVVLYGMVERDREMWMTPAVTHPALLKIEQAHRRGLPGRLVPIYRRVGALTSYRMETLIARILERMEDEPDVLPGIILKRHRFPDRLTALRIVHQVKQDDAFSPDDFMRHPAYQRLIYEDLFLLQVGLSFRRKLLGEHVPGVQFSIPDDIPDRIRRIFPFELTDAQKRTIDDILSDMARPHPMHRLLQGDVGSGKTAVAMVAMMVAVDNGYQVAFMAPTELLAEQHYYTILRFLGPLGYQVDLLTGSVRGRERREILQRVKEGKTQILVGTHALIQKDIQYARLGLAVIDEQHRFGVYHRARLRSKGQRPDTLVMTATPIPRSLALTLYGDLDVSVLDELPPGRKPVATRMARITQRESVYRWVGEQLKMGKQAYIVCPLIEESDRLQVQAAVRLYDQLRRTWLKEYRIELVHGQIPRADRERIMQAFHRREIDALVATTVIEVGVDNPNATIMVIEHAERFGLAQLHQLRGRVGRGPDPAYCILLVPGRMGEEARERIKVILENQSGFVIAEKDLQMRGPGELAGIRQSGLARLRVADILRDARWIPVVRRDAEEYVQRYLSGGEERVQEAMKFLKGWAKHYGLVQVG